MSGRVPFEFRTTVMRELHTAEDMRAIGEWLSGEENFFLQTYRDSEDMIRGGFSAYSDSEMQGLVDILRTYIPRATLR